MAVQKTNAMRILDKAKVSYNIINYENKDGKVDGVSVAKKIGRRNDEVFKTLVTTSNTKNIYVFLIPVHKEIDFKKAAKVASEKSIEMIDVNDLQKITGYIRGGCSPIGMKKQYTTFIDKSAEELNTIIVSGGKIGVQLEISTKDLYNIISFSYNDIIK